MMNVEELALNQVQAALASKRELPLSVLGPITLWCNISPTPYGFTDESKTGTYICASHKMHSIGEIGALIERLIADGITIWLYKLYEYDEYEYDEHGELQCAGREYYTIRFASLDLRTKA